MPIGCAPCFLPGLIATGTAGATVISIDKKNSGKNRKKITRRKNKKKKSSDKKIKKK